MQLSATCICTFFVKINLVTTSDEVKMTKMKLSHTFDFYYLVYLVWSFR